MYKKKKVKPATDLKQWKQSEKVLQFNLKVKFT